MNNIILPTLTCKRCGHTWIPRSKNKPKTCPNPYCKSPYWEIPRADAETGFYTKAEKIAEDILKKEGWNPRKLITNSRDPDRSGSPDFQCSKNRYVEVKKFSRGRGALQISENQIKCFKRLLLDKKKVFLMIFSEHDEFMDMFCLEYDSYWDKDRGWYQKEKGGQGETLY